MKLTDQDIEAIARKIAGDLQGGGAPAPVAAPGPVSVPSAASAGGMGIFATVDEAVAAAKAAFPVFSALPLEERGKIIENIRAVMRENATALAKAAFDETGYGRFEDKILKNQLVIEKTPGIEDLQPVAHTGDHGLTLLEPAPYGIIGAITPTTNPTSTIICNTIGMIAAGNVGGVQRAPHGEKLLDADHGPDQQGHRRFRRASQHRSPAWRSPTVESANASHETSPHPPCRRDRRWRRR
jgi:aldehyde dehydrogenase